MDKQVTKLAKTATSLILREYSQDGINMYDSYDIILNEVKGYVKDALIKGMKPIYVTKYACKVYFQES